MMKGDTAVSPERRKKMNKASLSKTAGGTGKVSKREAILNRMSSGKKRPRSEPRIGKRASEVPPKDDPLSRRLFNIKSEDGVDGGEEEPKKVKVKAAKAKLKGQIMKTPCQKRVSKEPSDTASKWKVTDSKVALQKPAKVELTEIKDAKKVARKKSKTQQGNKDNNGGGGDDDDDEVDFPILKRKSLGIDAKVSKGTKLMIQGTKLHPDSPQKGAKKKAGKRQKVEEPEGMEGVKGQTQRRNGSDEGEGRQKEEEKKRKRKRRGKKRRRSTSESEEPQAKKERPEGEFPVRCGNLPIGTSPSDLSMFLGEADVFPKSIAIKSKRKTKSGGKKSAIRYATVVCSSAEESARMCALNGISMPSTVGNRDCRLLIYAITADRTNDSVMLFKRKLFIRNLHHKITEDELFEYFEKHKFNPTNVIFPRRGDVKKTKGTALVWLKSSGDADRALGLKNPTLRDQVFAIARCNMPTHAVQEP